MTVYPVLFELVASFSCVLIASVVSFYLVTYLCRAFRQRSYKWPIRSRSNAHLWEHVDAFDPGFCCNICNTNLFFGVQCQYCGIVADETCTAEAAKLYRCKNTAQCEKVEHQWIHGNVPPNSVCFVCHNDCGCGAGLIDYRCCWCQRVTHEICLGEAVGFCDLGEFKSFIVPPHCVELQKDRWLRDKSAVVKKITIPTEIVDWRPLFVLGNRASGSGESLQIMKSFRRLLNPIQIFDLDHDKPAEALKVLQNFDSTIECCIVVAGGDGTFGWILETIESMQSERQNFPRCTMALLPLGTGNDLSRVLGWAIGDLTYLNAEAVMHQLMRAKHVGLDRWTVNIARSNTLGVRWPVVKRRMSNYLSIGVDALVTYNFHQKRNSLPRVLSGRFMNKLLFFTYGTKDVIDRFCRNLHLRIDLFLDGQQIELPPLEAVVVLNIPSWGAGVQPWQLGQNDSKQSISDGILEVFGVYSAFHIAQMQVGLSEPYRIGQAKEVTIYVNSGLLPMQIDGEPWQQAPCTITVSHYGRAVVLSADEKLQRRSRSAEDVKFGLFA